MQYAFMCWPEPRLAFSVVLGVFTVAVVVGPFFKAFHHRRFRVPRAIMYILLALVFPLVWWIMCGVRYGFMSRAVVVEFYLGMALCLLCYGIGIVFYLTRFPECVWPGRFDKFGQSHTWWHLWVVAGAAALMVAFFQIMLDVREQSCDVLVHNTTWWSPY